MSYPQLDKPYCAVTVTHAKTFLLHAGPQSDELLTPDDYVYLHPHWYRVNEQRILQCVGKTSVPAHKIPQTRVGEMQLDLECLLNQSLSQHSPYYRAQVYVVFFPVSLLASLDPQQATAFPACGFALVGNLYPNRQRTPSGSGWLYTTDKQARLAQPLAEFTVQDLQHATTFNRRFKELTGIDPVTDVRPLGVSSSKQAH